MSSKDIVTIHEIKFKGKDLCDAVYSGEKTYEIRLNDRDYKVGDIIAPISIDNTLNRIYHPIDDVRYVITYISYSFPGVIQNGYCVFGMKPIGVISEEEGINVVYV